MLIGLVLGMSADEWTRGCEKTATMPEGLLSHCLAPVSLSPSLQGLLIENAQSLAFEDAEGLCRGLLLHTLIGGPSVRLCNYPLLQTSRILPAMLSTIGRVRKVT